MQHDNQLDQVNFTNESINLREEIEKYVFHWKWFVLGGMFALLLAFLYLRYSTNQYQVSSTILVEGDSKGSLPSELSAFQDLGLSSASSSFENEIELLKSRSLMERVVKDIGINVTYYNKGRIKTPEIFYKQLPIKIHFFTKDSAFYRQNTSFVVRIKSATTFSFLNREGKELSAHVFGENIKTDFGELTITPINTKNITEGSEIIVKITPLKNVVGSYLNRIHISEVNKKASVIKITLTDPVKLKAEAVVNNLVKQYNKDAVEDKSVVGKNTNLFINERLKIINEDLLRVEVGAEDFKKKNNLTDITSEATLVLGTKSELEATIINLSTQLKLVDFVQEHLSKSVNDLIPANLGLADSGLEGGTLKYNELLLERNRILQSSSTLNPVIVNLDTQIENLRSSIIQSLTNLKASLTISLNSVQQQESLLKSKLSEVPRQEREYRSIERQQQIIEALYLYLLQKREENAITLAVTLPNAKIIDVAYGSDFPIAPKRNIIYLGSLLLGIIIPFGIIYMMFLLDNKVHTKKDIEKILKAPILGDVPKSKSIKKIVVSENERDSTAESFRLLRTNINFMLSNVVDDCKTIFVTSTLSGEGKTFISINLASVLALTNKKVLLIGADIRKPKITEYLNIKSGRGLTHFLMDTKLTPSDVVEHVVETNFDMIHSGILAPNPSELLMNGRFEEILAYGKQHYDFVIVDTAPVNLVTDTLLIGHFADLFIYIIRANFLDKRLLEISKVLYQEKRLPNMAVLMNDVNYDKGGYGYGYGYGYGEQLDKAPWWKRIFS